MPPGVHMTTFGLPNDCRMRLLKGGVLPHSTPMGSKRCPTSNLITCQLQHMKQHHLHLPGLDFPPLHRDWQQWLMRANVA